MMVSLGAACWLYLFPMALPINSCMPDYTQHYCTFHCGDTKTYDHPIMMMLSLINKNNFLGHFFAPTCLNSEIIELIETKLLKTCDSSGSSDASDIK